MHPPSPDRAVLRVNVGLLGTGFGQAHAHIYHNHEDVDHVVVFGRSPSKLEAIATEFGFTATTDPDR
jgi:predicted dehydrogenase